MCSQANTSEAWLFDLTLICSRVTHICSVDVCPAQFMVTNMPAVKVTWKVKRLVVLFPIVSLGEKETTEVRTFALAIFRIWEWSSKDFVSSAF